MSPRMTVLMGLALGAGIGYLLLGWPRSSVSWRPSPQPPGPCAGGPSASCPWPVIPIIWW